MTLLKPIQDIAPQIAQNLSPPVQCEGCGKMIRTASEAMNVIHIIQVGSPGHASMPPFQCPNVQHWACSPECWRVVAHACIDEHMHPTLMNTHSILNDVNRDNGNSVTIES